MIIEGVQSIALEIDDTDYFAIDHHWHHDLSACLATGVDVSIIGSHIRNNDRFGRVDHVPDQSLAYLQLQVGIEGGVVSHGMDRTNFPFGRIDKKDSTGVELNRLVKGVHDFVQQLFEAKRAG